MKHGKKYNEAAKLIDRAAVYEPAEAISLVKKTATAKFDETVEIHVRTGCDGRHAEQQIRFLKRQKRVVDIGDLRPIFPMRQGGKVEFPVGGALFFGHGENGFLRRGLLQTEIVLGGKLLGRKLLQLGVGADGGDEIIQ